MKCPLRVVCIGAVAAFSHSAWAAVAVRHDDESSWLSSNPFRSGARYAVFSDDMSGAQLVAPTQAQSGLSASSEAFWTAPSIDAGTLAIGGSGPSSYLYASRRSGATSYEGMIFQFNLPTIPDSGIFGVGVRVRLLDSDGQGIAGRVRLSITGPPESVRIANSTALVDIGASGAFVGFWMDRYGASSAISSLWVGSEIAGSALAVETLFLGVPTPGTLVLLGSAALGVRRRRRR